MTPGLAHPPLASSGIICQSHGWEGKGDSENLHGGEWQVGLFSQSLPTVEGWGLTYGAQFSSVSAPFGLIDSEVYRFVWKRLIH